MASELNLTPETVRSHIPEISVRIETRFVTTNEVVRYFYPRDDDIQDAKLSEDTILDRKQICTYFIPNRQRFFVWDITRQNNLIDSMLKNFPLHNIIVSKGLQRGIYDIEDGQQRLITIWRYMNNLFAYSPMQGINIYYNSIPTGSMNAFTMEHDFPDIKERFDNYNIHISVAEQKTDDDVLPIIFERLNTGKPLNDSDKLWNRKDTYLVSNSILIASNPAIYEDMKKYFDIDARSFEGNKTKRNQLSTLVGIVLGLSQPFQDDNVWGNILTKSYSVHLRYLDDSFDTSYVIKSLQCLLTAFKNAIDGDKSLKSCIPSVNRAFTRFFGVMIYHWRLHTQDKQITPVISNNFISFWTKVIDVIRSDPNHIDNISHFISNIYTDKDNKGKNANIGMYIRKRYENLITIVQEKGIYY